MKIYIKNKLFLKWYVFSFDLKTDNDSSCLNDTGSSFQTLGAVNEKLLSPNFLNLVLIGFNKQRDDDLRDLFGE